MGEEVQTMARKPDPNKTFESASGKKYFHTQYEANERWAKDNPRVMIGFRVTPEEKERIDSYIDSKAKEETQYIASLSPEDQKAYVRKYSTDKNRASVNTLLKYLLNEEMNGGLDGE